MANRFPRYTQLLRLYPKAYRDKYAPQMVQTLADMLDDQPNKYARLAIWLRIGVDLPVSIVHQNIMYIGEVSMPTYIKRNGIIAGLLLVPFLLALIANALTATIYHRDLYNSVVWSTPVLTTWIIILPSLALLIALASYINFLQHSPKQTPFFQRLHNVKQVWPIALAGSCGLGILCLVAFHDSAHCPLQNPLHTITQPGKVWQCTTRGFLGGN